MAYYRCRFPHEYALANRVDHPRNVILREDLAVPHLDGWLAGLFTPASRQRTIDQLTAVHRHLHVTEEQRQRFVELYLAAADPSPGDGSPLTRHG